MVRTRSSSRPHSEFALVDALLSSNPSVAQRVLGDCGASVAAAGGPSGFTPLHALALTDCHRLVAPLVAAGADADAQIAPLDGLAASGLRAFLQAHSKLPSSKLCAVFRGVAPLHIASWLGHQATVAALLQAGADPEVACLEGRTSLAIACYFVDARPKRSQAIIQALLEAGADPLCADFHGISSLCLSPHCPPPVQQLLLDRVLARCAGPACAAADAAADALAGAAVTDASAGEAVPPPPPPVVGLSPEKHVDVLQASLASRHWPVFDFFLAAASAEVQYPVHAVNRILSLAIISGDVALVGRVLASGLRPDADGLNSQGHPHVAVAAVHGHEGVLDLLCERGGGVSLRALHHAVDMRSIGGLQLLLARGRPPVLAGDDPVHIGGAHSRAGELCLMLRLLRDTAFRLRYCYRVDLPRHASESLAMVEVLAAAGYRPTTYPRAIVHSGWVDAAGRLCCDFDPTADKPQAYDLTGVNKFTWLAAKQQPWTPERHAQWPPRFRRAVQHLLLCHHAGRPAAGGAPGEAGPLTRAKRARQELEAMCGRLGVAAPAAPPPARKSAHRARGLLGPPPQAAAEPGPGVGAANVTAPPALSALPPELLMRIFQEAAYPISAWV